MKYFFANWKMYAGPEKSHDLADEYAKISVPNGVVVAVCPTALSFQSVASALKNSAWKLCVQNVAWTPDGAYTGAVSAEFFREAGAVYALVGHSERRHIFNETDPDTRKKMEACIKAGITPILCVGETAEDKETGKRQYRLKKQLLVALENLNKNGTQVIIAYEPVWAIHGSGSGALCAPADVADVHGWIAEEVKQYGIENAVILYGGSVDAGNSAEYAAIPEVNGFLVGSASLHTADVGAILLSLKA